MLDFLNGDPHAAKRLKLLKGRVADWQEHCFSVCVNTLKNNKLEYLLL